MLAPPEKTTEWKMHRGEFIALMAMLQALQALAIDVMLPALGIMAADLGATDPNQRQLVIGVFLMSAGVGALFPGLLADRFGRRPVLLTCVTGYVVFGAAAAFVTDFTTMLVMRALAGLLSSGLLVVSSAVIRDRFSGDRMASLQSMIAVIFMIVPMAAPALGQAILLFGSWRWIFGVMALLGAAVCLWAFVRLPETLHPEFRQPVNVRAIGANMRIALTTRSAIGYVIGMSLVQGGMFGYINSSQQLVAEHFGTGEQFPLYFAGMALAMALASLTNSRIVERFGARRVSHAALLGYIVTAALQLWFASGQETIWQFVPLMTVNMCLMGFIGANFASIALQPFARIAGAAASLQAFLRMILGSSLGALIGAAFDGTARPLAIGLLLAGIGALVTILFSEHGRLFRRLHGQVQQV